MRIALSRHFLNNAKNYKNLKIINMAPDLLYVGTDPIWTALIRFFVNLVVLFIVIRLIYYNYSKKEDDLFTYFLMGIMIFMVCVLLQAVEVKIGMALGLFAVFSILRFRTSNFNSKSMAYFFTVIGISAINALVTFKYPVRGTLLTNSIIILTILILEIYLKDKTYIKHQLIYDKLDLLSPDKKEELIKDISERTGKKIHRIEIKKIDLIKRTSELDVFYVDIKRNKALSQ